MGKLNAFEPMTGWQCEETVSGLAMGSARSTTTGGEHGSRQNASTCALSAVMPKKASLVKVLEIIGIGCT
jgi:hypothetical protein